MPSKPTGRKSTASATTKPTKRAAAPSRATSLRPSTGLPAAKAARAAKGKPPARKVVVAAAEPASKQAQLITQLRSPAGATLAKLVALTGWQPHTVRGTISGVLRKKLKLNVTCLVEGGSDRVYRIAPATAAT